MDGMFFSIWMAAFSLDLKKYVTLKFTLVFPQPPPHKKWRSKPQTYTVSQLGCEYLWFMLIISFPWHERFKEAEGGCQTRVGFPLDLDHSPDSVCISLMQFYFMYFTFY